MLTQDHSVCGSWKENVSKEQQQQNKEHWQIQQ